MLISQTFYEQFLVPYPVAKKIANPNCKSRKTLQTTLVQKPVCKMLIKLTPIVNFTNILQAAFSYKFIF